MTPAAARAIPAKVPTEVRPARDLLTVVADAPAAEPDELPEPLPPLPPSEKPVAVALAEVLEPEAVPDADAEPDALEEAAATDETVTPADCLQVPANEDNAVDLSLSEQALWMSFCTVDASFEQMVL